MPRALGRENAWCRSLSIQVAGNGVRLGFEMLRLAARCCGDDGFHVAFTLVMPRGSRSPVILRTMEQVTLRDGKEPPLAAHLVTPRRGYIHHGLYVGEGRVIHYPGLVGGLRRRAVEEVSLEEFARGRPVAVRMGSQPRFAAVEAILRARSRLGENRYDIIRNNCEHFCEWCLSGVSRSRQLESVPARLCAAAIAILDATATWAYRTLQPASL